MPVKANPHPECRGQCGCYLRRASTFTEEDRALLVGIITNYIEE